MACITESFLFLTAAVLSPSAATPPFSSTTTTTAASAPNDDQVQGRFWPLISTGGGFGGSDQHGQLLQETMDYYNTEVEAASGADSRTVLPDDLQEHGDDYLCSSTGATPLSSAPVAALGTDAPNDNLHVGDSEREINSGSSVDGHGGILKYTSAPQDAPAEPAAAGLISSGTGASAVEGGSAGWTSSMELLYWRDMAFDAGDPYWSQLLPSCTEVGQQYFVDAEEEEEAEFRDY